LSFDTGYKCPECGGFVSFNSKHTISDCWKWVKWSSDQPAHNDTTFKVTNAPMKTRKTRKKTKTNANVMTEAARQLSFKIE
jgi:hypothetical protein